MSRATSNHRIPSLRAVTAWIDSARAQWLSMRRSTRRAVAQPGPAIVVQPEADPSLEETLRDEESVVTRFPPSDLWRELSPAEEAQVRDQVRSQTLSPTLEQWIVDYGTYGPRNLYLWKWCALGARLTTLPCVDSAWREHACDTKVLSIMLNVLVDDVADRREHSRLLPPLLSVVRGAAPQVEELTAAERAHVEFTAHVRREYWQRVETYPCAAVYRDLLDYDLEQLFNAIHYSALLNQQLGMLNVVEHDLYSPHNMMMMSFATLDLMCAPAFQTLDLGKLREAIWHAQWMGRIGNLLATWEREIAVGDFTSGVFAQAISRGDLTVADLQSGDRNRIAAIIQRGGYHAEYCRRWRYHRERFQRQALEVRSVDLRPLLEGHDRFFRLHLGSRGFI